MTRKKLPEGKKRVGRSISLPQELWDLADSTDNASQFVETAIRTASRLYLSPRGYPLIYCRETQDKPVLTVENYVKWYEYFTVNPDGSVSRVDFESQEKHFLGTAWYDHCPNPRYYRLLCEKLGFVYDEVTHNVIIGRYELDVSTNDWDEK